MQARNSNALSLLCQLLEEIDINVHPEQVWHSSDYQVYEHLHEIGALYYGQSILESLTCNFCGEYVLQNIGPHDGVTRGYCVVCGWVELSDDQCKPCCLNLDWVVNGISRGLGLISRFEQYELITGRLWYLGEYTHRRKLYKVFWGRQLADKQTSDIENTLQPVCPPHSGILLTTSDKIANRYIAHVIPLQAVAHVRKTGLTISNLNEYLDQPAACDPQPETSLRPLATSSCVLIEGRQIHVPPTAKDYLTILHEADGEPLSKACIARRMEQIGRQDFNVDKCVPSIIFGKGSDAKLVRNTFVGLDGKGNQWLKIPHVQA